MEEIKFIADVMLGKLSKWLRILGFDTLYYRDLENDKLISLAIKENRHILTRKTCLKNRNDVKEKLIFIKDNDSMKQLREVIEHLKLEICPHHLFTRCLSCNQKLQALSPELIWDRVPEYVYTTEKSFSVCPLCKKIFWKGTHFKNMQQKIKKIFSNS